MERLTKLKDGKYLLNHSSMNKATEKLGKLEDILDIYFKLNKNKKYYWKNPLTNEIYEDTFSDVYFNFETNYFAFYDNENDFFTGSSIIEGVWMVDYGEKWAVTREELEENGR